ncbi:ABC transporter permease [Stella sp.]|uniref:ABC transporter permease n=1 Tax=Stella sp. TaxID=2912054 RepID=UPI0035AED8E6
MSTLAAAIAVVAPNRAAAWAFAGLLAICALALTAPLVAPYGPADQDLLQRLEGPSAAHWFGTDNYGRDILSRILWGARISLLVGLGATLVGMAVGGALGIWAGFKGGLVDLAVSRLIDVLLSFPSLILCLLIVSLVGPGVPELVAAIAVSLVPKFARVARSSAIAVSHREFVDACRTVGGSDLRIMAQHIAPNTIGELTVMASLWTANAVLIEASLSFLGLGVRPPTPTLGGMMLEGLNLLHDAPWLTLFPGLVILVMVLLLNLVGDRLRDAVDPRLREV